MGQERSPGDPVRQLVAVFGASGFVGSAVVRALRELGNDPICVTRDRGLDTPVDVIVNAACPSRRYEAERDPLWDFDETVAKTARIFYGHQWGKFLHISSLSAKRPVNVYGKHRLAAESIAADQTVIRLGPMYGEGMRKGVLLDILNGRPVYADERSRYAYADVDWVGGKIADVCLSPHAHRKLVFAGSGYVTLRQMADAIGSPSEFRAPEYPVGDEEHLSEQTGGYGPDSRRVLDYLRSLS